MGWGLDTFRVVGSNGPQVGIGPNELLSILGNNVNNVMSTTSTEPGNVIITIEPGAAGQVLTTTSNSPDVVEWADPATLASEFDIIGDATGSTNETVVLGSDDIEFMGGALLEALTSSGDVVTYRFDTNGAVANDVPTYNGSGMVWAQPVGDGWGTDNFFVDATDGDGPFAVDAAETVTFAGVNVNDVTRVTAASGSQTVIFDLIAGNVGQVLTTTAPDVIQWQDPSGGSLDTFFLEDETPGGLEAVSDDQTVTFTGSFGLVSTVSPTRTVDFAITNVSADPGDVLTIGGGGQPEWSPPSGGGQFDIIGDAGGPETIDLGAGDDITFGAGPLLQTLISSPDQMDVTWDYTGAAANMVPTYNGSTMIWALPAGDDWGSGSFDVGATVGSPFTINNGDQLDILGVNVGNVTRTTTAGQSVIIDIIPGATDQVLTTNGSGDVVWADNASTDADWYELSGSTKLGTPPNDSDDDIYTEGGVVIATTGLTLAAGSNALTIINNNVRLWGQSNASPQIVFEGAVSDWEMGVGVSNNFEIQSLNNQIFEIENSAGNERFQLHLATGNLTWASYPNTRDDMGRG